KRPPSTLPPSNRPPASREAWWPPAAPRPLAARSPRPPRASCACALSSESARWVAPAWPEPARARSSETGVAQISAAIEAVTASRVLSLVAYLVLNVCMTSSVGFVLVDARGCTPRLSARELNKIDLAGGGGEQI